MDQAGSSRGVIAAGWSLHYNPATVDAPATPIAIPTVGAMAPIAFAYSGASPTARVRGVDLSLILSHTFPDDLEMVLQSPSGTTAIVMADAGGSADLVNTALVFRDTAASLPPDGTLISSGSYRPGASGRTLAMTTPAGPHGTAFSVFDGEPVAGIWRLWIPDDYLAGDGGSVVGGQLGIQTDFLPPLMSIDTPTSAATFTSTQMFLTVGGEIEDLVGSWAVRWRNVVDGAYYDQRRDAPRPAAERRLRGQRAAAPWGQRDHRHRQERERRRGRRHADGHGVRYAYYLSEGATGGFFDTSIDVLKLGPSTRGDRVHLLARNRAARHAQHHGQRCGPPHRRRGSRWPAAASRPSCVRRTRTARDRAHDVLGWHEATADTAGRRWSPRARAGCSPKDRKASSTPTC